jgi:hydroxymethylpyrimidine pyrophosphatase-like HAD family hydrolase
VDRENSVSVAMGNGNDRVKAAAEYVTGDHNDAGMGATLHRFALTKATTKL